jgi:hypothetical protein
MTVRAADERPRARQHLLDAIRLGHVVVGARVDAVHLFRPAAARGQDQHRHRQACVAPLAQKGEAVHARQAQVQEHGVVLLGARQVVGAVAGGSAIDGIARRRQRGFELRRQRRFVLHDQDAHRSLIARPGLNGS